MAAEMSNWPERRYEPPLASPPTSFELETQSQDQCPLFSRLPAEVRIIIFEYTLTDYESSDYFYAAADISVELEMRHDYRPRRSTSTQLLRTCQRIYSETWLMPFILAEHIYYAGPRNCGTNDDVRQDRSKFINLSRMKSYLSVLKDYAENHNSTFHIPKLERMRYYYDITLPNPAFPLGIWSRHLAKDLGPKCVTFSLNYKNSWMRHAYGYNLSGKWVNKARFSRSVTRICMELGKFSDDPPLREIVSEVVSKWFFRREDGIVFRAAEDEVVYRRWVAYAAPDGRSSWMQKVYIIPMITWKPVDDFDPFADGYKCPDLDLTSLAMRMDRRPLGDITGAINRFTAH